MNELRRLRVRESGRTKYSGPLWTADGLRNLNLAQAHGNAVRANDLRQISLRCGMGQFRETIADVESDHRWHAGKFDGVWVVVEVRSGPGSRPCGTRRPRAAKSRSRT